MLRCVDEADKNPDPARPELYVAPEDATPALASLGLDAAVLVNSVRTGVESAQGITPFHPVTARGFTQWSETVAYLRHELVEQGWKRGDPQNSPRVLSPDGAMAIMVIGGNADTGISLTVNPRTARRRGPATRAAVQCNDQQVLDINVPAAWTRQQPLTWVLLYHWSKDEPVVRAELSLPVRVTDDDDIAQWSSRILLPPQDLTGLDLPQRPASPQDDVDFRIVELS